MNQPQTQPQTPGELYDLLQEMYGIGDYDHATSTQPWFKERMHEVVKLKALLRSRHATVREVTLAAHYARAEGIPVHAAWQLFALIPRAVKAQHQQHRRADAMAARDALDAATQEALDLGEESWAARLTSAGDQEADQVLKAWRSRS